MFSRITVCCFIGGLLLWPVGLRAQSSADLSSRVVIDAQVREYTAVEAVFRNTPICDSLAISPCPEEEPSNDSSWSDLQDVEQIFVTWDAQRLVVGVSARIAGHALVLYIDYRSGGLREAANLAHWRRALRFGPELRPDAFVAVYDGDRVPELVLVSGDESLDRVPLEDFEAVASFAADAPGRALEISIPWSVLFPDAVFAINPDSLAPAEPMFVLPTDASQQGLRLSAVVVHAQDGLAAADVAPNTSQPIPLEPRTAVNIDRSARVDWDAQGSGVRRFVDFGVAVQTQSAPRFVPDASDVTVEPFRIMALETFRADTPSTTSRVLFPEAGVDLGFAFVISEPQPTTLYVSASIFSMRGERVADLARDEPRACSTQMSPYGCFGVAARDRWDGRDRNGALVPGGMYLLRVSAGVRPGLELVRSQKTIAVVD